MCEEVRRENGIYFETEKKKIMIIKERGRKRGVIRSIWYIIIV